MANLRRLIDLDKIDPIYFPSTEMDGLDVVRYLNTLPTVDAVVLPCKIGDKVYRIAKGNFVSNWKHFVQELTVTEINWKKEKYGDKDLGFAIIADGIRYKFTSIGKSVFLTREEAELALAKMGGDGNG